MIASLVDAGPRPLGRFTVGPLAYGLWRFRGDDVAAGQGLIEAALDAGMNLIDTADIYGFEPSGTGFGDVELGLGQVFAVAPQLRDRMVLATKGGIRPPIPYDSSPTALRSACEHSLRRLGVDVIDVYQIHRPDLYTHPGAVAETLMALRAEGKIIEIGVSNHTPAQVAALAAHLDVPIVATQPEFSPAHLDPIRDGTLDQAMQLGLTPLAWSPLGGGRIATGDGVRPELLAVLDRLAEREGVDRATIALAFVLAHPSRVVPIIGSQRTHRIAGAKAALTVTLDRTDVYQIVVAGEGAPLP